MDENEKDPEAAAGEHAADVDERKANVARREAALAERREAAVDVLAAADQRDAEADKRDELAVQQDRAADLAAFVAPNAEPFGQDNAGRRRAAMDRLHAKNDRSSSAGDRQALIEDPVTD